MTAAHPARRVRDLLLSAALWSVIWLCAGCVWATARVRAARAARRSRRVVTVPGPDTWNPTEGGI